MSANANADAVADVYGSVSAAFTRSRTTSVWAAHALLPPWIRFTGAGPRWVCPNASL